MGSTSAYEDLLERELTEIIVRRLLDSEAEAVLHELHAAAGDEHEVLARVSGTVAGFCMSDATAVTCQALIVHIRGAARWASVGRQRRMEATRMSVEVRTRPERHHARYAERAKRAAPRARRDA